MTNHLLVSMGRPGPTTYSHQPASGASSDEATWLSPVRACWMRIAFVLVLLSVPQVSKASSTLGRYPPVSKCSSPIPMVVSADWASYVARSEERRVGEE